MTTYVFTTAGGTTIDWGTAVVNGVAQVDIYETVTDDQHSQRYRWAFATQPVTARALREAQDRALSVAVRSNTGTLATGLDQVKTDGAGVRYLPAGATASTVRGAQNLGDGVLDVVPKGTDTVDGGTSPVTLEPGEVARFQSDGAGAWSRLVAGGGSSSGVADGSVTLGKLSSAVQTSLGKADASAQKASNLSDLTSAATARTSLGLGSAATMTPAGLATDAAFTGGYAPIAGTPVASSATSGTLTAGAEHALSPTSTATWTLPTGVAATKLPTTVKNNGTAAVTVARGGSDTINGGTASTVIAPGEWARYTSNGAGAWTQSGTAGQSVTYGQLWATPAASTTLTGTLVAWTVTSVDCTAGAGARTLPAASSVTAGTAVCAKKSDTTANNLVVSRAGSDLIFGTGSGATSKTQSLAGEAVEYVSNGVDRWTIRASDTPSGVLATTYAALSALPKYPDGTTTATSVPRVRPKDPRDYGVVMNCATDSATLTANTTAFQAFITDIVTNGLEGIMPAGEVRINAQIDFSYRPSWTLRGSGRYTTTIKQYTDNVPILNLGSDTASAMHSFVLSSFGMTYNNSQPSTNTTANPILFSQMAFNGRIENLVFQRGSYAMRVANGIGCPWGTSWDDLMFSGGLTAGAMDWNAGVNGVPNNHWGRFTVNCDVMVGPVFKGIRGYNFRIDDIEFLSATLGPNLMTFTAGSSVSIGTLKVEVSTWSATQTLFSFSLNNLAQIDEIVFASSTPTVNALPSGQSVTVLSASGTSGFIRVGSISAGNFSSVTGAGSAYLIGAGVPVVVDHVSYGSDWQLTNIGGSASAELITITEYSNGHMSQDKGDADYTVALSDPSISVFNTAFTAPRTINLPSTNSSLVNGLYYEFIFNGAINGSNTAVVKCGATTLATISADATVVRFTYRRNASSAANGWLLTKQTPLSAPGVSFQAFTTAGTATWNKPAGATTVRVYLIGGAGGGGSGRRGAAGSVRCGGGGGGATGKTYAEFAASDITSSVTVTVGAGGTGGAAQTVDSTDGSVGNPGGVSKFGGFIQSGNGGGGGAGTATAGAAGAAGSGTWGAGQTGSTASATGGTGGNASASHSNPSGGAGGGGITSGDSPSNGGVSFPPAEIAGAGSTTGGTAPGGNGNNGISRTANEALGGYGGGGGAGNTTGAGGTGGNGGKYGGGGAGGGASLNGNNSGAGGNGADGIVIVVTH